jgi:5-methyltetrahydrofolate--homocysteine methyltransferase
MEAEKRAIEAAGGEIRAAGRILLATVKGDVHDIGKNIVGVVLGCNNYEVIDLGVMVPCDKILETARERKVDVIGLSGLITPSLDEMSQVAREMDRLGLKIPLLIGGATTSKAHTAVKIAPGYQAPVIHVLDASRAVPVVSALLSPTERPGFVSGILEEYQRVRQQMAGQQSSLISLEEARRRAFAWDWTQYQPPIPAALGAQAIQVKVEDLIPFIDWSPFFHTWELRGRYPAILEHPKHGEEARKLFADAGEWLTRISRDGALQPRGVYGFFPANRVGDDIVVYEDEDRRKVHATFHFLRQQTTKEEGQPYWCLADFIAPASGDIQRSRSDYLGAFAVTSGHGLKELVEGLKRAHDDYSAIMAEALADRLAEAFAEYLHLRVRREWGYEPGQPPKPTDLIDENYRGIRPAAGYPASPDHTEKSTLWRILDAEAVAGISLTENYAMWPGSSVSGLYFSHPESKYFAVGKLGRDQIQDLARRKSCPPEVCERWLGPWLNYEPGVASS